MKWLEHQPLAPLTTLGVGGKARWFAEPETADDWRQALAFAKQHQLVVQVLGGGSNVVVADAGLNAVVLRPAANRLQWTQHGQVSAESGVRWDELVIATVQAGLQGLECLSGIPGMVGSAPVQNIGAYGQELDQTLTRVQVLDRQNGQVLWLEREQCQFAYRDSYFKRHPQQYIVLQVQLQLEPGGTPAIAYAQLREALQMQELSLPLTAGRDGLERVREAVLALRRSKAMCYDTNDFDSHGCGSFFTNPVVMPEQAQTLSAMFSPTMMPCWPQANGSVKLSAAWLIERSGLHKGQSLPDHPLAALSRKHVLALVNRGGASADAILGLASHVQRQVLATCDVWLEPEPVLLGFDGRPLSRLG